MTRERLTSLLRHPDLHAALALMLVSAVLASTYLFRYTEPIGPQHGIETDWFSPAVMLAAGRGFVTPVPLETPGLADFLLQRSLTFDSTALPESVPTWHLSSFCQTHRYLLYAVALVWKLFGISWESIKLVPLIAHVISTVLLYGLFRLIAGRKVAGLAALFVMLSPPVMAMLPSVRDFSKMPFFFGILLLLGILATRPSPRVCFLGALGLGALCGIGLGFRQDFLACLPPAMLGVALLPATSPAFPWKRRLVAAALVPLAFIVTGFPIFHAVLAENGAVSSHSLAQGLSTESLEDAGLGGAPYALLATRNDNLVHATITTYAERAGMNLTINQYLSPEYGEAGRAFFRHVAFTFPYDIALRAFAAVRASFEIMREAPRELANSPLLNNAFARALVLAYALPAAALALAGPLFAIAFCIVLAGKNARIALALALITLYFTGYTSVLFQFRHAFHLAFVGPWFLIACVAGGLRWRQLQQENTTPFSLGRAFVGSALFIALAIVSLLVLRGYQHAQVRELIAGYRAAALTPLHTAPIPDGNSLLLAPQLELVIPGETPENINLMQTPSACLALQLNPAPADFAFEVVYDAPVGGNDFTQTITLPPSLVSSSAPLTCYFPVYLAATYVHHEVGTPDGVHLDVKPERAKFLGVRLAQEHATTIKGLYRIAAPEALPFFLQLWLPEDQEPSPLNLRLR